MNIKWRFSRGFTLIELMVVIIIIGLLSSIAVISFNDVQAKVRDTSVLSDLDAMDAAQTNYAVQNNIVGIPYYSGTGYSSALDFTPSEGNIIDVTTNEFGYCIRGYNAAGTRKNIYDAFVKESSPGMCSYINPSVSAKGVHGWQSFGTSMSHSCGIWEDLHVYCWGRNDSGQNGIGSVDSNVNSYPLAVSTTGVLGGKTIKVVSGGKDFMCVIASDDKAYCWGHGTDNELGDNNATPTSQSIPVAVASSFLPSSGTVKAISSGDYHTCVIASDNKAYCWGNNSGGQLGDNTSVNKNYPVAVQQGALPGSGNIKAIASSNYTTCAIAVSDNHVYCWGDNNYGQIGDGTSGVDRKLPKAVVTVGTPMEGKTIVGITGADNSFCALDTSGKAYCWGENADGQLGNNDATLANKLLPDDVYADGALSGKILKTISSNSSSNHVCALDTDGKAYCWGSDANGALGNDLNTTNTYYPVAVDAGGVLSGKKLISIIASGGVNSTLAIDYDGNGYSWGGDNYGQLCRGANRNASAIPVTMVTP